MLAVEGNGALIVLVAPTRLPSGIPTLIVPEEYVAVNAAGTNAEVMLIGTAGSPKHITGAGGLTVGAEGI
jgi:hypothetical protein